MSSSGFFSGTAMGQVFGSGSGRVLGSDTGVESGSGSGSGSSPGSGVLGPEFVQNPQDSPQSDRISGAKSGSVQRPWMYIFYQV